MNFQPDPNYFIIFGALVCYTAAVYYIVRSFVLNKEKGKNKNKK